MEEELNINWSEIKSQPREITPKRSFTSLLEELKYYCHPGRFLEPYDKNKVDIANELYDQIKSLKESDTINIRKFLVKAIKELESEELANNLRCGLLEKFKQQIANSDYDHQKIAIANDYYNRIINCSNINEILEIEEELIKIEELNKDKPNNTSQEVEGYVVIMTFFVIVLIVFGIKAVLGK